MISTSRPFPGVMLVTMDRPERRNALDLEAFRALARAWDDLEQGDARVGVVTGGGGHFSSGADLASIGADMVRERKAGGDESAWADVRRAVLRDTVLAKPVVSAVEGICFGGGMELVGGTDIRVAAQSARFALPEVRYGLIASGGSLARLSRQIPYAAAMEILLTGAEQPADRMLALGYVNHVVDDGTALDRAMVIAKLIAENAPSAVGVVKSVVSAGARVSLAEAYQLEATAETDVLARPDAREGPRAFIERRPPSWRLI